jgi:RIO kinase 2
MERIDGVELARTKLETDQVLPILNMILSEVQTAYRDGYVHADMSEYNVFVAPDGVTVFDWPQAVPTDHANSTDLLERDVENTVGYFQRKYPGQVGDCDVTGLANTLADDSFDGVGEYLQ